MTHNAYAALAPRTPLVPFEVTRRDLRDHDVALDVLFSGICHSDIHQVDEDWGPGLFPMVPGHEIVGVVTAVGPAVSRFRVGERVGVGTFVDSCRSCRYCVAGDEQYCVEGPTGTYNSLERDGVTIAYGGYADRFVVDEAYAVHVADSLDPAGVAPLMCAGITLYSPLRHWGAAPGVRVGIVGLGGLGHMGVKFAHALGAETTVFSHSPGKVEDAARLGADHFVTGVAAGDAGVHRGEYDLIINTVSADLDLAPYFDLLKVDGTLVVVGLPRHPYAVAAGDLVNKRRALAGSMAGGTRELQEMLDFCARHDLTSDVEVVPADYINTAYQRTLASDVKYRFVIDASTIASR